MDQNVYQLLQAISYTQHSRLARPERPPHYTRLFQTWLTLQFRSWKIEIQHAIEQRSTQPALSMMKPRIENES